MPFPAALAVGQGVGNMVGQGLAAYGMNKGAKAAQGQVKLGMKENAQALTDQNALQQPYQQGGQASFNQATQFAQSGDAYKPYESYKMGSFGGVNMQEDPGVQYRMDQSTKALNASAAGKGSLFSGAQQKALQANAQNLASQEFGNAYNRQYGQFKDTETAGRDQYNLDRTDYNQLNRYKMGDLMDQGQMGQQAATQMGSNIGTANTNQLALRGQNADLAAKRAGGFWTGMGNAVGSGVNTGANSYMSYMMGQK